MIKIEVFNKLKGKVIDTLYIKEYNYANKLSHIKSFLNNYENKSLHTYVLTKSNIFIIYVKDVLYKVLNGLEVMNIRVCINPLCYNDVYNDGYCILHYKSLPLRIIYINYLTKEFVILRTLNKRSLKKTVEEYIGNKLKNYILSYCRKRNIYILLHLYE